MAMSQEEIREAIAAASQDKFPNADMVFVRDTYDDYAVVAVYPKPSAVDEFPPEETYRVNYTAGDSGVTIDGDPERVREERSWLPFADFRMPLVHRFADFASYEWEQNPDGTWRVKNVPIFRLGTHRGYPYDDDWAAKVLQNFMAGKSEGYLPTVIKGHTAKDEEKPAHGFMDNLRLDGGVLVTDYAGIDQEFHDEIVSGRWPYRSVELTGDGTKLSCVAMLGSSMPFHKFPALMSESGADVQRFVWTPEPKETSTMAGADKTKGGGGSSTTPPAPDQTGRQFTEEELNAKLEEQRAKFAEERRADSDRIATLEAEAIENRRTKFAADLKSLGFAPAVIDSEVVKTFVERGAVQGGTIKFGENDTVGELDGLRRLFSLVADQASKGALLVPKGGPSVTVGDPEHPGSKAEQKPAVDTKRYGENVDEGSVIAAGLAQRYAEATKVPLSEAARRIRIGEIGEDEVKEAEAKSKAA